MDAGEATDWEEWDFCIRIAGNTATYALITLWGKGYDIRHWTLQRDDDDFQDEFEAKKDGRMFSATSPEDSWDWLPSGKLEETAG